MSLIDDIKRDREAGTPRDWVVVESVSPDGQEWYGVGVAEETCEEFLWFEFDPERDTPRARRIARVPDMEAALLAAEELADVVNLWREALSDKVLIPLEVHTAITAFQKALK